MKAHHILALAAALLTTVTLQAGENGHGHSHEKKAAGPNGGRLITGIEPNLEFFVTEERKVKITAVDDAGKPIALGEQSVSIITGDRSAPTELSFTKTGETLTSDAPIPEGNIVPAVLRITPAPGEKPVIERINVNLATCSGCDLPEYACICAH